MAHFLPGPIAAHVFILPLQPEEPQSPNLTCPHVRMKTGTFEHSFPSFSKQDATKPICTNSPLSHLARSMFDRQSLAQIRAKAGKLL